MEELKVYHRATDEYFPYNSEGEYIDPFYEPEYAIPRTHKDNYFLTYYGITYKQAYNLSHGFDLDYNPKCEYCNEVEVGFLGARGYRRFCCRECQNTFLSNLDHVRELHSSLFTKMNEVYNSDPDNQAYNHFSRLINEYSGDDKLYFYIYYSSEYNLYKFGVTNSIYHKRTYGEFPRPLVYDNFYKIASLEYLLSRLYRSEWTSTLDGFMSRVRFLLPLISTSSTIEDLSKIYDKLVEYIQASGNSGRPRF